MAVHVIGSLTTNPTIDTSSRAQFANFREALRTYFITTLTWSIE